MSINNTVLFIHPAGEHFTDASGYALTPAECITNGEMPWSGIGRHYRKFIKAKGEYLASLNNNDAPDKAELYFWGEWETESKVTKIGKKSTKAYLRKNDIPQYIHEPIIRKKTNTQLIGLMNTDPYVFGENFCYCCCQQGSKGSILRKLNNGDIIVFYGKREGRLLIDTVFVVDKAIKYNSSNYREQLKNYVSEVYMHAAIEPLFADSEDCSTPCSGKKDKNECNNKKCEEKEYTFYTAVMYGSDYAKKNGIFSYFPCKIGDEGKDGFSRFEADADKLNFSKKQTQGIKILQEQGFWQKLTQSVLNAGYKLGVKAEEPDFAD